jgi:cytochrome c oxidase subunit 2
LFYWFQITGEAPKNSQVVEVTGSQFKWEFRYPGRDGKLGKKYYKNINEDKSNPLGQIWEDPDNRDDIVISGQPMHVVVNKPVKLVIGAKDVIHDVGLAHFRMKMDAVPGMPTTMWFTPKHTTREMKAKYGDDFEYEISCDQMCGPGHYGMRGVIVVESEGEFKVWLAQQQSQYAKAHSAGTPANPSGSPADSTSNPKPTALLKK